MVVAKAAQLANSDSREQFQRARAFFESLHKSRQASLRQSYERSLKVMAITHKLCGTDPRVVDLEQQSAERMFRKKEANLNELHMAQNLEEASYLETMFGLLNRVTEAKEVATTEIFQLEIAHLKAAQKNNAERAQHLHDLQAEAVLKMAELVAHYAVEQSENTEDDIFKGENIARTERKKDFQALYGMNNSGIHSVSELYDNIIWSAATSRLGFSTTGSSIYTEDEDDDDAEDEEGEETRTADEEKDAGETSPDLDENHPMYLMEPDDSWANESGTGIHGGSKRLNDEGSAVSGSTSNTTGTDEEDLSVVGRIHVRRIKNDLKLKEQALMNEHRVSLRAERRKYRKAKRELKLYHQSNIDNLLRRCVDERYRLRDEITSRMASLEANQELDSKTLQESIDTDVALMKDAWAEHKRLEDEEKSSFEKAQALVSAQVFHEVRNALSSVIAMSELTSQLRNDPTVTSSDILSSVNKMLDQNEEVVHYSLTMLNNILDINKIRTGEFKISKDTFDLTDLMQRATTMQMAKAEAKGVKMRFETPKMGKCLVCTDRDIVLRIITNFISNAVKFTSAGAIQPFILPLEDVLPNESSKTEQRVAVGVADSGIGLDHDMLNKAKAGLYNSDTKGTSSGAKNSGFGLHLAHQLAATLGTNIYLTDLSHSHGVLNNEISEAFRQRQRKNATCGTVLFVTIPVFEEGKCNESCLRRRSSLEGEILPYEFNPKGGLTNHFRILIADDVLMLRKGLVRSVLELFQKKNVPVLVHTACTAEDALRVIKSQSYDIIIADNQYSTPDSTKQLRVDEERPHILLDEDETTTTIGESASHFFRSESFTMKEGDGELSGLKVMQQLLETSNNSNDTTSTHPIPILILLSGHKFDLSSNYRGLIVAQKPLRTSEIVPLLEANAQQLLEAGLCIKEVNESGKGYRIMNQRGTQIFSSYDK